MSGQDETLISQENNKTIDIKENNKIWQTNIQDLWKYTQKLKYKHVISNFYYYQLKGIEGMWSWIIILISTFTSGITVINNVDEENLPIKGLKPYVNATLTISSMITSLIAAWIKKKQFVEKINELDRYILKINKLIEELEFEFTKPISDKMDYNDFKNKYFQQIQENLTSNPPMSPKEWKSCVKDITQNYPEIIGFDDSPENALWPWFSMKLSEDSSRRAETIFYERFRSKRCWCCRKKKPLRKKVEDILEDLESVNSISELKIDNTNCCGKYSATDKRILKVLDTINKEQLQAVAELKAVAEEEEAKIKAEEEQATTNVQGEKANANVQGEEAKANAQGEEAKANAQGEEAKVAEEQQATANVQTKIEPEVEN